LLLVRELDERLGLGKLIEEHLTDTRQGENKKFPLADLVRQSVYSRLAGAENLIGLMVLNRELIAQAEGSDNCERVVLDMDSTERPVNGRQEGGAYNGHYESVCYHPLLLFNQQGDCLAARLRPGNVSSAEDWDELLLPEIERQQAEGKSVTFRADAAFAKPEIYEALEERGVSYVIRIPANKKLEWEIADVLFRPPGRPGLKSLVRYKSFAELVEAETDRRQGPAPCRRVVPARRLHRDQHEVAEPFGGAFLQQARHGGAVDQGRQASDKLDAAVVPSLPLERSAVATGGAGLQPGQPVAAAGAAAANQELVADESAVALDEDRRAAGEARAALLAPAGRRTSEPAAVWRDAQPAGGATGAGRAGRRASDKPRARAAVRQGRRSVAAAALPEHKRGRGAVRDAQRAAQQRRNAVRRGTEGGKPLHWGCKLC
jgi:hypothetical protein